MTLGTGLIMSGCNSSDAKNKDDKEKQEPLILTSELDSAIHPGDDFYDYVNRKWIEKNPIPETESRWGVFNILADESKEVVKSICEDAAKNPDAGSENTRIIGYFYGSAMDSAAMDAQKLSPLKEQFDAIQAIKDGPSLAAYLATQQKTGGMAPFAFFVEQDMKNTSRYISYLVQSGLGMPDRDYYFRSDEKSAQQREAYKAYVKRIFSLYGMDDAAAQKAMEETYAIEEKLAKASMTLVEQRDPQATYHLYSTDQLKKDLPNFDWNTYYSTLGTAAPAELVVGMPKFMKAWNGLLKSEKPEAWKNYYVFHLINSHSNALGSEIETASFDFYEKTLKGINKQDARWKRVTEEADVLLRDLIGEEYVKRTFDENAKKKAQELVDNLKTALKERITNLSWMGDSTKLRAQEKLGRIMVKIGYPDKWRSYKGLAVSKQPYVKNQMAATEFEFRRMLGKLGKEIDRSEWAMGPQTVNAYYNPLLNEIVFPAAILQPPFFNPNADDALNYGGIGMVIGHELTHGFDDQGRQFDADGNLKDWWTAADAENFKKLAKGFVDQYNKYVPIDDIHVNGELTLGENIADLGGMIISYQAFKNAIKNKRSEKIDGLTPDQRFFLNFAIIWRGHYRKEAAIQRLYTDVHSPAKYRVIGVLSNFPAFYEAFGVTEKNKMYTVDSLRCKMW